MRFFPLGLARVDLIHLMSLLFIPSSALLAVPVRLFAEVIADSKIEIQPAAQRYLVCFHYRIGQEGNWWHVDEQGKTQALLWIILMYGEVQVVERVGYLIGNCSSTKVPV